MTFKNFLQERTSSRQIWSWIQNWRIPLSPKFFEEVFGYNKEHICYVSIQPGRIPSMIKRQNSKNGISSFHDTKDAQILWGAGARSWEGLYPDNLTVIAQIQGKVTIKGNSDVWAFNDAQGRRWVDVNSIIRYNSDLTRVLNNIQSEIKEKFPKKLEKLKFKELTWHITKMGNISLKNDEHGKDNQLYIKAYIDTAYEALKKYQKKLENIENIAPKAHYNEWVCYDYKMKTFFAISENPDNSKEIYPDLKDAEFISVDKMLNIIHKTAKDEV